jgi:FixJ family two-component response regulator
MMRFTDATAMHDELQLKRPVAYVIDDDAGLRDGVSNLLRSVDIAVEQFGSTKEFLDRERSNVPGCLVLDVRLPGMSGLEFQAELGRLGIDIPIVFITGHADVPMGVKAMKAGAIEFLCKPFREQDLLDDDERPSTRTSSGPCSKDNSYQPAFHPDY